MQAVLVRRTSTGGPKSVEITAYQAGYPSPLPEQLNSGVSATYLKATTDAATRLTYQGSATDSAAPPNQATNATITLIPTPGSLSGAMSGDAPAVAFVGTTPYSLKGVYTATLGPISGVTV
jgi:hypothetical protein